jgi:hypothetical protein
VTKEINDFYGTKLTEEQVKQINDISSETGINVGDIVRVGTIDGNGNVWIPSYDKEEINVDYLKTNMEGEKGRVLNGHRIIFTDQDLLIPGNGQYIIDNEPKNWKSEGEAIAHNLNGESGNIDYRGVGSRKGQQLIVDKNGNIVLAPENKGTYDYVSPEGVVGTFYHFIYDVRPWEKYGNSPVDTTTKEQRSQAVRDGIKEKAKSFAKNLYN